MTTNRHIKNYLKNIIAERPNSIDAEVAKQALEYSSDCVKTFFADLLQHGCQSGMISSLIYYSDTHKFYDTHYYQIEDLRLELENSFGEALLPKGDLKNWYAWFAFEETARKIADKLELGV